MGRFYILLCFLALVIVPAFGQHDSVKAKALLNKAIDYDDKNQLAQQLPYLLEALAMSRKADYHFGVSRSLGLLGDYYREKGNLSKALDYYYKGLRYDERNNDKNGILIKTSNIGIVYDLQGDLDKAHVFYASALEMAVELDRQLDVANQYVNLANIFSAKGENEKALIYQFKALEIDQKLNDERGICADFSNISITLGDLGRRDEAQDYAFRALELARKMKDYYMVALNMKNIAEDYQELGKLKLARTYFEESLKLMYTVDNIEAASEFEKDVSTFYSSIGEPAKALDHYKQFIVLRDSVFGVRATEEGMRAEMNYEFEKKRTATKFEHDKKIYRLETRNRLNKQLGIFLGIVLLLLLVLLFFVRRAFSNKKRLADFLATEDQRKEILLQEVHHRINNNLQIISSLLILQANAAEDERLYEYLMQSQNRIQSLAVLHELMYDTGSPLEVDLQQYLDKILDFHRDVLATTRNGISIETHIQPLSLPTKLAVPLALIMNELVTNAIKYAFGDSAEGKISIGFTPEANDPSSWIMTVADNGIGMPPDSEKRKDSLGLKLVNLMTRQIKGQLTSENNGGAVFTMKFSLK